jgi:hypothetical protein
MISAHSSYQGVGRWVWVPETFAPGHKYRAEARPTGRAVSRERLGDWDAPMAICSPLVFTHPPRWATWPNGEWG